MRKGQVAITTNGTYPWSFVTYHYYWYSGFLYNTWYQTISRGMVG